MKCPNCNHNIIKEKKNKYEIIEDVKNKFCSKCHAMKPITEYDKINPKKGDTLRGECRECRKILNAARYQERKLKQVLQATKDIAN